MALSTESAGRVRQKVREHTKNPAIFLALKSFFLWLSSYKKDLDLQFLPITGTSADDANGQVLVTGAGEIYAFYGRAPAAAAEASVLMLFDDATSDAGAGTDGRCNLYFDGANSEAFVIYPTGITFADGVVAKSYTDFDGVVDTTSGSAANGFAIVAAS